MKPASQPCRVRLSVGLACLAPVLASPLAAQDDEVPRPQGLVTNADGAFQGYTLISPLLSNDAFLLDMSGEVVHTWKTEHAPGNSVYLQDDGTLVRCVRVEENPVFFGGGIGGRVQRLAWDGEVLWDWSYESEVAMHHHDIEPLPNGNILLIAWELLFSEDAIALGRSPDKVGDKGFWPDSVIEVEPVGKDGAKIVWEWHAYDHLVQDYDEEADSYGSVADQPGRFDINADHRTKPPLSAEELAKLVDREERMRALGYGGGAGDDGDATAAARAQGEGRSPDWMHTNSIDYDAANDLILLSSPRLSEIWILDHSTTTEEARGESGGRYGKGGQILWRYGNPRNYGAAGDDARRLFAQHDAQWIPPGFPGAGNVLVFNNGGGRPDGEYSSVDELVLPFEPATGFAREPGYPFQPWRPVWRYAAPERSDFFSGFISGCQRLRNGNTLICSGAQGRLFEVTSAGAIVWEYYNVHGGEREASFGKAAGGGGKGGVDPKALFRAERIAPDHPGLAKL